MANTSYPFIAAVKDDAVRQALKIIFDRLFSTETTLTQVTEQTTEEITVLTADSHARLHGIDSTLDHNGVAGATEDNFMSFNGSGLPKDSGFSDADFEAAGAVAAHASDPDAHKGQKNSIELDAGDLQLVNDEASPGNNQVYGTDGSGVKGWRTESGGGSGLTAPEVSARVMLRT